MDDRAWYLAVGTLLLAFVGMILDATIATFDIAPGFYPFLGIFSGAVLGIGAVRGARRRPEDDE